jgi:hypothetical protein
VCAHRAIFLTRVFFIVPIAFGIASHRTTHAQPRAAGARVHTPLSRHRSFCGHFGSTVGRREGARGGCTIGEPSRAGVRAATHLFFMIAL